MKRALLAILSLILFAAFAAVPATADPAPSFVETQTDNPVTAEPPVSRPAGPHCTVTLANHFLSNGPDGAAQDFSGTLTPPSACPGPWAKVVMDYTVSVSGRQYDRFGDLRIGSTEVWWGTTEEPSGPTPITYTVSKDVTRYDCFDVSRKLRERGWLVPAYTMPPKREDLAVLRVVVRNGFSHDMADLFLRDVRVAVEWLDNLEAPMPREGAPSNFHH